MGGVRMPENPAPIQILGISGSPHHGATEACVQQALAAAAAVEGVQTTYLSLADYHIEPCNHCDACRHYYDRKGQAAYYCNKRDDFLLLLQSFYLADGYIIGVPAYDYNLPALFKDFIDRFNCVFPLGRQSRPYAVGGAIALCETRHGGQELVLDAIMDFYAVNQILLYAGGAGRGAAVWADDQHPEELKNDQIGLEQVHIVGQAVAKAARMGVRGYGLRKEAETTRIG